MKRINVLQFAKTFNNNDFVDVVIRHADRSRFSLSAVVYSKSGNDQLPDYKDAFPIHTLDISVSYMGILRGAWRLSRLLRKERVDVLHTHHFYESVMGMIACALVPACKLVVGRHYHNEFYLTAAGIKLKYYLFVEALVNRKARVIISPSSQINSLLEDQGVDASKVRFVPYGFDFSAAKYQPVSEAEKLARRNDMGWKGDYLVGNFSRHHKIKGQLVLLDAFRQFVLRYPDSRLIMVGSGPLREVLESRVTELGLRERVVFLGWQKNPQYYLAIMDVVAHPTLQEAFPQIMVETLALEIPLVITPVSGASDVIKNGTNGLLVEPGDSGELSSALNTLRSTPALARAIGRQGRIDVLRDLRIQDKIGEIQVIYEEADGQRN